MTSHERRAVASWRKPVRLCRDCRWCEGNTKYASCEAPQNFKRDLKEHARKAAGFPYTPERNRRSHMLCVDQRFAPSVFAWLSRTCGTQGRWWQPKEKPDA